MEDLSAIRLSKELGPKGRTVLWFCQRIKDVMDMVLFFIFVCLVFVNDL